jgi:hypothetical protein
MGKHSGTASAVDTELLYKRNCRELRSLSVGNIPMANSILHKTFTKLSGKIRLPKEIIYLRNEIEVGTIQDFSLP